MSAGEDHTCEFRTLAAGVIALTAIAGSHPAAVAQQEDKKAAEVLAAARKAIGGKKLDSLKSLSVQAAMQRNVGNFQMNSDRRAVRRAA